MDSINSEARFASVEVRNVIYRHQTEVDSVIAESKVATFCFDLSDLMLQGVDLYEGINSLDEDWRLMVHRGECSYEAALAGRILALYAGWLETSEKVLALYNRVKSEYDSRGFDGSRVEELAKAIREVRGILTPDDKFFGGPALKALESDAIAEHAAGRCFEV